MATVTLRAPLRDLAGGRSRVDVGGSTVEEILTRLEGDNPRMTGWILDERGRIREHLKVFVNGERAELSSPVTDRDLVHVLASISGGGGNGRR